MTNTIKTYCAQGAILLLRLFPASLVYALVRISLKLVGYRKAVIESNLQLVDMHDADIDQSRLYKRTIDNLARVMVETFYAPTRFNFESIYFADTERLREISESTNGVILLASHYGNWELACMLLPKHTDMQVYGVYKPLKDKFMDQKMKKWRSRHGLHLIPRAQIARTIATNVQQGRTAIYIFIADQNPDSANNVEWADFLGVKTAYPKGVQKLYNKYKLGIAYMAVTPNEGLYKYSISIDDNFAENQIIQEYSTKLEEQILAAPEYWLWSHKRWKRKYI